MTVASATPLTIQESTLVLGLDARKAFDFGIGSYVRGLLGGLSQLDFGFRVVVFGPAGVAPPRDPRFEWVEDTSPGYSLRELWSLSRQARKHRLDLFHALHYVVPFGLRCRRVVTIHDLNHLRRPEFLPHAVGTVYADRMIRRALCVEQVIAVSAATAADLRLAFGVRGDRIEVVPNGIDERFFDPPPRSTGAPAEAPLLFVGNPKPHKNLEGVLRAMARQRQWSRLVVAGSPPSPALRQLAADLGVADRIDWRGFVPADELPDLYRQCLALVLVSKAEGFGLPVAEAMACGRPVVISRLPALLEVAGDAALVVVDDDLPALAAALDRLAGDSALRERLGENAVRAAQRFHWRFAAQRTLDVYRRVLFGSALPSDPPEPGGFPREVFSLRGSR